MIRSIYLRKSWERLDVVLYCITSTCINTAVHIAAKIDDRIKRRDRISLHDIVSQCNALPSGLLS